MELIIRPLINYHTKRLIVLASVMSVLFFVSYHYRDNGCSVPVWEGCVTAYNIYKYNSIFYWYDGLLACKNYEIVPTVSTTGEVVSNHPVVETIGWSVVAGLLWKLFRCPSMLIMQVFTILLFILSILYLYRVLYYLFESYGVAYFACMGVCLFFPLVFTIVQGRKDVAAYVGIILIGYLILDTLYRTKNLYKFTVGGFLFALIQYVRSPLFAILCLVLVMLLVAYFYEKKNIYVYMICILAVTNIAGYWVPLFTYNKTYYDRYFVGPTGHALLTSLGEYENPWGAKPDDSWCQAFVITHKNPEKPYGTPEFDDEAKQLFWGIFKENPGYYFKCVGKRIKKLLFINLSRMTYRTEIYDQCLSFYHKCRRALEDPKKALGDPWILFNFFPRVLYMRLFLLLGYCGMFCLFLQRRYKILLMLGLILADMPIVILSHIEDRYVIVHYWIFGIFAGYFVNFLVQKYRERKNKNIKEGKLVWS